MKYIHLLIPVFIGVIYYVCFKNVTYFYKLTNFLNNCAEVFISDKSSLKHSNVDIPGSSNKELFTREELSLFDGKNGKLYLSILGKVFDVTKGKKYYAPGEHYHCFTGNSSF